MKKILSIMIVCSMVMCGSVAFAKSSNNAGSVSWADANQQQGQVQAITDSGNSTLANSGNSAVLFENSFNGSQPIRYLPLATDVNYVGMAPQMFSRPSQDKGENFIAARNLVSLMGAWNITDINDSDFDESDVELDITTVGISSGAGDVTDTVTFMIQGSDEEKALKSSSHKTLAIGSIKTDSKDVNTVELFMVVAKKAKELGASNVILIGEGVKIELESSGWGIGLAYNYAGVNSEAYGTGQVGAGGTGYSQGSASYHKLPYLMFAFKE